jgi:uncharacterized protein
MAPEAEDSQPTEKMKDLKLTEIWIYPIKSLGGIRLKSARVMEKGLYLDRRWMLVDAHGQFLTQRALPQMALFSVAISGDELNVVKRSASAEPDSIRIGINSAPIGSLIDAKIWDDDVRVLEVDPVISGWFTKQMGFNCKLVSFPEQNPRPVDMNYKVKDEQVSLADAYPFLIIGQNSLDDLNKRLETPVPMNRFRPNFVFTGGDAYEEDHWRNFRIGKNRFVGVKKCGRCVLTTVNQDTAEKGVEPLFTLSTYRKENNKVNFGQNLVAADHTVVNEGDPIILE